jgi:hypothetical protein
MLTSSSSAAKPSLAPAAGVANQLDSTGVFPEASSSPLASTWGAASAAGAGLAGAATAGCGALIFGSRLVSTSSGGVGLPAEAAAVLLAAAGCSVGDSLICGMVASSSASCDGESADGKPAPGSKETLGRKSATPGEEGRSLTGAGTLEEAAKPGLDCGAVYVGLLGERTISLGSGVRWLTGAGAGDCADGALAAA